MIEFSYLYKGICGLANAHKAGTMAGHLGAAVVAGYLFGEDHSDLTERVSRGIEAELERVIAGEEAFWFNAKKTGITPTQLFQPFADEKANADSIISIAVALQKNVGALRESGHNTIFAAIAIRALRDHENYATPQIVSGIRKLIAGFDSAYPGRGFYGRQTGWLDGDKVQLAAENDFPAFESIQQMADTTIKELIATAPIRKQGFGGLWHVINHAAAITELDRFGYHDVAQQALPAFHQHIRLWRSLPDVENEIGAVIKAPHDPRKEAYWDGMLKRDEARLTHRIKTLYGFYTIERFVEDQETKKAAADALLYLMD